MFTVYVLKDQSGKFYKGVTVSLDRRYAEHVRGKTITTRKMRGLEIVYTEKYLTGQEARKREKYLKSAAGRRFLKKVLGL